MTIPRRTALEVLLYRISKRRYRISGRLPESVKVPQAVGGRPVYLVHNPKCAGSSLKQLLGVSASRTTHSWPRDLFRPSAWEQGLVVVAVRHPLDRFSSSWRYHCRSGYRGKPVKRHGSLRHLSPSEYFDFIQQYPENLGLQSLWVDYPSRTKPECDIVLRVEESTSWLELLASHGIAPTANLAPHLNTTDTETNFANSANTGLSDKAFYALCQKVEAFYQDDYLRFHYDFLE